MKKVLKKIFGSPDARALKSYEKRVADVNSFAAGFKKATDKQLRQKTDEFKQRLEKGESLDDILPEAFAVVRETSERKLGLRPFDVQLIGGMALHDGNVAEMKTGEGKTLVATMPIYLNALEDKGVHLVTVNDYLAQRDAGWMAPIYNALGLSVAVIVSQDSFIYNPDFVNEEHEDERFWHFESCSRQEAYAADITYGMNSEFGFDYLRDNMVREASQLRQRELNYAIVDEVDSILIDEARTPLIISAPASSSSSSYGLFAQIAKRLQPADYEVDEKQNSAALTDEGVEKVQQMLGIENLYSPDNINVIYHLEQALRAETLFKRDKNYVVSPENEIIIVDEFTGRMLHGRRYSEGLHQAIEAKEGVEVQQESMTLATISYQNYFRLYKKLGGMTGTAKTEEEEFQQVYNLDVVEVPTNKPVVRDDRPDRIYATEQGKFQALIEDVKSLIDDGQPVLIGTASIEKNELLSRLLTKAGIKHEVLNAKNHEREAQIVAEAGKKGAVTLATNIAGRGTDIKLGDGVVKAGGLVVLGSERHESRRIDNQLRGRGGRQGDPGMTQFYVSADDDLMRIFGGDRIKTLMTRLGVEETVPIENRSITKALENAQKKVEGRNFDIRKNVVQYDDVMNRHRKSIYSQRQQILKQDDISDLIEQMLKDEVEVLVTSLFADKPQLKKELSQKALLEDKPVASVAKASTVEAAAEKAQAAIVDAYEQRTKQLGKDTMRQMEREIYLQTLDTAWMQHLENMQHLREGIGWRSIGQRDPLVEYRREGKQFFDDLESQLQTDIVRLIFRAEPPKTEDEVVETELTRAAARAVEIGSEPSASDSKSRKSEKSKAPARSDSKVQASQSPSGAPSRTSKAQRKRKKKARRRK